MERVAAHRVLWLSFAAIGALPGCSDAVLVTCSGEQDCPPEYTCNANHNCILKSVLDAGYDLQMCVDRCDSGLRDMTIDMSGDAQPDGADLKPMCTQATVMSDCTDVAAPVCNGSNICAPCSSNSDDLQCAAHMNGRGRCNSGSGECVACRTDTQVTDCATATAPICDGTSNSCRTCLKHSECPSFGNWPEGDATSGVCLGTGACASAGQVLLVDNRGMAKSACDSANATRDGSIAHPFCDVTEALPSPKPFVLVRGSAQSYENITIPSAAPLTIAIIGPGLLPSPAAATLSPSALNTPVVSMTSDNTHALDVTLDGLVISGAGGAGNPNGVQCASTSATSLTKLRVVRSVIQTNAGLGISASSCDVTVDQAIVGPTGIATGNTGGGISLSGCTYAITDTLIHHNGSAAATKALVMSGSGSSANLIVNVTIADNLSNGGAGAGLFCAETVNPTIFNVAANGNTTADQTACTLSTSAFSGGSGTNQNTVACSSANLFVAPTPPTYNYAPLVPPGGACAVALTNSGTVAGAPDHDLYASPRPLPGGSKPDVGAIEVP